MSFRIAVIGCGLIGTRRACAAAQHPSSHLAAVVDSNAERRALLAATHRCRSVETWEEVIDDRSIDIVVVSTPNGLTAEIGVAALHAGKHILVEKPPGRTVQEAQHLASAARQANRVLKIGFNHRYHPAISRAYRLFSQGKIGKIINLRARYGHGGRPGYEKEWRGDPVQAGGGELTDQGVHVVDLIRWFAGQPAEAIALLQTAVWPLQPLEDNAVCLLRFSEGALASFHTSWTQWKNLFSFEVFGTLGALSIEGLGGSYGVERLVTAIRNPGGGVPVMEEECFDGPDVSWEREWDEFMGAVEGGQTYWGTPEDGVGAMAVIDTLYRSSRTGTLERIAAECVSV